MHGLGRHAAHPEGRREQIRAGPQVLDRAQILGGVALFLQRVVRRGRALHRDLGGLELKGLGRVGREHQLAAGDKGRAHVLADHLIVIGKALPGEHDLQALEGAAVVELQEAEILHIPDGAAPAAHGDGLPGKRGGVGPKLTDLGSFHGDYPSPYIRMTVLYGYSMKNSRQFLRLPQLGI